MEDFLEILLVIPFQTLEMTMVGHPHLTSVEESVDDNCIVDLDLGVFPETVVNKNMLQQLPKEGTCPPDPVLDFRTKWSHSARGGYQGKGSA